MNRCFFLIASSLLSAAPLFAQEHPVLFRSPIDEAAASSRVTAGGIIPIPLPFAAPVPAPPVTAEATGVQLNKTSDVTASLVARDILFDKEQLAFRIDAAARAITRATPERTLSTDAVLALQTAPAWLEDALRLKFILLAEKGVDGTFARLILNAEDRFKDEAAFVIAHSSVQTLTDTRFAQDRAMIVRNAEMIYRYADSLRYVRLVEHGTPGTRDHYTTTTYRIYDSASQDTVWSEIPRDIYYWYLVHPKMDQEGVYVRDNSNDNSGQRSYDFAWRDFIWNNPDPVHEYTQVNITTSKGTVSTIQRFGELMKSPTYLWDRRKVYLTFNRPFQPGQSALDVLGNWASRALPVDVTLPRAFQPNQILMKHNGMCNEDAFLVAAACRTALIPIVYLGCYAEDHVFGSVWDVDWNHYEFFRGGLAPNGNQYYGITNMLAGGSYGWKISMVEATRPDGRPMNFTKYYTNTCDVELRVTDSLGTPMEGAMVQVYAPYGTGYAVCQRLYTGADGTLSFQAGEQKRYLVNVYHPSFGWSPADSTRAYYMTQANTVAGVKYNVNILYPNVKRQPLYPNVVPPSGSPSAAIRLALDARDIRSGVNVHDAQRSRFYDRDSTGGALLSVSLLDEDNYTAMGNGQPYTALGYTASMAGGTWAINIPSDRVYYLVLRNTASANLYTDARATCELLDGTISGIGHPAVPGMNINMWPNPVAQSLRIAYPGNRQGRLRLFNTLGATVLDMEVTSGGAVDVSSLPAGVYLARVDGAGITSRTVSVSKLGP